MINKSGKASTEVSLLEFPRHLDPRGNLAVIEEMEGVPFKIKRVHWIYDVPGGGLREGHCYRDNHELIIALSGSFDVVVTTPGGTSTYSLNRSYKGLYLPPMTWRELVNFSTNSVALVLSSEPYSDEDYVIDYEEYRKYVENGI
ncbi:MAG: FdtA/QdtA family cupin domain-containing protein [Muribaculaceae bacterium]|nr:FdtA/QdtA family cupin domain-containing protein [Muribaculaceae bacterium]